MLRTAQAVLGTATIIGALLAAVVPGAAIAQDESLEELVRVGSTVYADNCAGCHGANGEGTGGGPKLAGNGNVESRPLIINQILWGASEHGMPSFAGVLDDRQVAAVATYVRNSWENDYGIVYPRSVELRRP